MTMLAKPAPGDSYALYRYVDGKGRLLYVGISGSLRIRTGIHKSTSSWMQFAVDSAVERFETPREVMKAERRAIETEHPLFNVKYNDTPEARERLRNYLEEIGRLDLLGLDFERKTNDRSTKKVRPAGSREWSGAAWFTSRYSNDIACVEIAFHEGRIGVRDTKDNGSGPVLAFTPHEWECFISGAKKGEFDLPK